MFKNRKQRKECLESEGEGKLPTVKVQTNKLIPEQGKYYN